MKVFLSYPREQERVAREIYNELRSLGLDIFFDRESLSVGAAWKRELEVNIADADAAVIVCSKETGRKVGELQSELRLILDAAKLRPMGRQYVLPVRVGRATLPTELSKFQYIDYESPGWLLALLRSILHVAAYLEESKVIANIKARIRSLEADGPIWRRSAEIKKRNAQASVNYFVYKIDSQYYNFVNARIEADALGDYYGFLGGLSGWKSQKTGKSELFVNVEEFFRDGSLISIRKTYYDYWFGAAHGNHFVRTINFGGEDFGEIQIDRLFEINEEKALKIVKRCDSLLDLNSRSLEDEAGEPELKFTEFINPEWNTALDMIKQFNIDQRGITFNFGSATGMPYVAAEHEVLIPWSTWSFEPSEEYSKTELFSKIQRWRRGY